MLYFLKDTEQGEVKYIFKSYILSISSALIISYVLYLLFPDAEGPRYDISAIDFFGVAIFSPVIETFLMIPVFVIIKKFTKQLIPVCIISAVVWACLHSMLYPIWGLGVFISFLVLSIAFQSWESSTSEKNAIRVVIVLHMLNNVTVFAVSSVESYIS